jgi:hypothetical protein
MGVQTGYPFCLSSTLTEKKQRLFYMGEAIPRFALMIGSLHTNMGRGME